jgi:3-hydroxy acid dehydrogenase / malonic semialdehyde reductase
MKKIALITGATSGIGEATALLLARNNYDLIITGRRNQRLEQLQMKIESESGSEVCLLNFDVRKQEDVKYAINSLPDKWKNIDVLINNAGLAVGMHHINEGEVDDWERMIDTNIKGLLYVTREVSPGMVERKSGHIINISSIAGREVYEKGNVYCASKHAVTALSKSMRVDLGKHKIKVTNIAPGAADTEFSLVRFKGDKDKAKSVYKGFTPLFAGDIAETILFVLTRPAHVNIDDLLITATAQSAVSVFHREE